MTILEAKRAQGFLDNEVLVGNSTDSFKIIGNSVARGVALALGLSLHEAWMQDGPRNVDISTPPVAVVRVDKEKFEGRRILEPSRRRRSQHVIPVINEGLEVQGSATSNTVSDDESSDAESYTTAPDQPIRNEVNSRSCDGFLGLSSQSLPAELRDFLGLSHQSLSASTASTGGSSSSSSRDAARIREIRASSESSIDDSPLSEPVFDNFIGYIATREKNQPPARGQSTAGLKRSFDMVEPATPESHKVPRQSIYESRLASSYRVVSPSRNGTDKRIDASVLADRLADLVSQSCGHLVRPIPDSESESEEDIKFIPAATYNFSAARSNHIRHRLSEQGTKATSKSKVVISLLSDDEDDTFSSSSVPAQQRKDTASNKPVPRATYPPYVPVDNSSLNVYAQTNQYMKFDVNRRHGPKSTW